MEDPVILVESGMVYERWAIQEWLAIGNNTCPCSYIELPSNGGTPVATLLPNDVLSQVISASAPFKQCPEELFCERHVADLEVRSRQILQGSSELQDAGDVTCKDTQG